MKLKQPFFSIIIPTYNRAELIGKTIESVQQQLYSNFELLIIDDGSTDNTEVVVKPYCNEHIHYFKKENGERAAARNYGIKKAKGAFITFLDSDDLIYQNYLSHAYELINKHSNEHFFHTAYAISTPDGKVIHTLNTRSGDLNKQLLKGNLLSCLGVFIRREKLLNNLFNEDRDLSGSEDWELWMRLSARYPIFYSNEVTASIIQHDHRSILNFKADVLIKRIQLAAYYIFEDAIIKEKYSSYKKMILAHLFLYLSLHLAMIKDRRKAFVYFAKASSLVPPVLFSKKAFIIIKTFIF